MAPAAAGRLRCVVPLQGSAGTADVGAGAGTAAGQGGETGQTMSRSLVDQIVAAVLYEGYLLYPYRASSVKNRQRWTFGGLYPPAFVRTQGGSDSAELLTECLILGGPDTTVDVRARFLHLLERSQVEAGGRVVDSRQ